MKGRNGLALRVEHDDAVSVGPGVIPGLLDEKPSDGAGLLLAAVQRDVHPAGGALLARSRHERITFIANAQRVGNMAAGVAVLIEALDAAAELPNCAGTQGTMAVLANAMANESTMLRRRGLSFASMAS